MSQSLGAVAINGRLVESRGTILVISDSSVIVSDVDDGLTEAGFDLLVASDSKRAFDFFTQNHVDYIFVDLGAIDMSGGALVRSLRIYAGDRFVPIIVFAESEEEAVLADCIASGCDDFIFKPFNSTALKARIASLEQMCELKKLYKSTVNEQIVAKQILSYALSERSIEFEEIKLLSRSKGVFSGDLFLTGRRADGGLHIILADFTGHGLSAAIGSLPVADIFSVMTEKGFEVADILENINNKLHTLLPISMFMACSVLKISKNLKFVEIWNGGMPDIYIRDTKTGSIKYKLKSNHIPLGINETTVSRFEMETVPLCQDDQLIIYTDGLTDAMNEEGDMFGESRLEKCIENNKDNISIFSSIVQEFNDYCGKVNPDDDVTLACIPCTPYLTEVDDPCHTDSVQIASNSKDDWCWYMELSGSSLRNVDPIPIVMNEAQKISGQKISEKKLSSVLNVLYENAIEHGIQLRDESEKKISANNVSEINHGVVDKGYLRIGLKKIEHKGENALLVSIEDSGEGFDHVDCMSKIANKAEDVKNINEGISLVYSLSESLNYHGKGNHVEAIISGLV
ncbi:Serine phosphatase RsbU, regulator of sigma subunit [hydrothermal vent metagenome]|uniref:Serine phosphatase RsbU, regulator of sigma subunit n=1 Tax=hydrothermal vent metagenome TaxID=652676 RepID=A0A3B0X850_9ZZZZ